MQNDTAYGPGRADSFGHAGSQADSEAGGRIGGRPAQILGQARVYVCRSMRRGKHVNIGGFERNAESLADMTRLLSLNRGIFARQGEDIVALHKRRSQLQGHKAFKPHIAKQT